MILERCVKQKRAKPEPRRNNKVLQTFSTLPAVVAIVPYVPRAVDAPSGVGRAATGTSNKGADGTMRNIFGFSAALVIGCLLTVGSAWADGDEVPLDKLPKAVVDTINAKFPKCVMKHATVEKVDGKNIYEVGLNFDKKHLHAVVAAEGKLIAIHRHIDPKELPDKVAKAVAAKYPKLKIDDAEEQATPEGKVTGFEVVVELNATMVIIIQLDPEGKILKESKETIKKDSK
jgi:hypothetical protein